MMEIKYEVTEEDYIKFNVYHIENSKSYKKTYNLMKYFLPVFCAVAIFFSGSGLYNQPKLYWGIIAIIFILIWIKWFPKIYEKMIRKSVKETIKDGDSSIICKNTMIIYENDINVISEHSTEITSKEGIKKIKVYDDMILIYISGFAAHIVPTRYLNKESKQELLEKLGYAKSL